MQVPRAGSFALYANVLEPLERLLAMCTFLGALPILVLPAIGARMLANERTCAPVGP